MHDSSLGDKEYTRKRKQQAAEQIASTKSIRNGQDMKQSKKRKHKTSLR
jgi:hypothetical protein